MDHHWKLFALILVLAASLSRPAVGQFTPATAPATRPATTSELTVAVLDFATTSATGNELGAQIGQTISVMLSGQNGLTVVERASLDKVLQEQELNLTGLVDTEKAIKVGKLVGAKVIVVGKAFRAGERLYLIAKLIGTETSIVQGEMVTGEPSADTGQLAIDLAAKINKKLRDSGAKLLASAEPVDPLASLRARLAGKKMPTVAVIVPEQHIVRAAPAADPAAETEIKLVLRACQVPIKDVPQNALANFTPSSAVQNWPQGFDGVDYVIVGQAFSDSTSRIGNLQCAAARLEINVIDRRSGKIVIAERVVARDVDLSENIASRKALQKTGRIVGLRLLEQWAGPATTTAPADKRRQ